MRWMRRAVVTAGCALLLVLPCDALAVDLTPPGHAGAGEYVEVIPTAAGNAVPPSGSSRPPSAKSDERALAQLGNGSTGASRLASLGSQGQAAAALAASTAPSPVHGESRPRAAAGVRRAKVGASGAGAKVAVARPSGSGVDANVGGSTAKGVAAVLVGSDAGGLGLLLPLALAAALGAAIAIVVMRRRRGGPPSSPGA
jgi:hypothetical protein